MKNITLLITVTLISLLTYEIIINNFGYRKNITLRFEGNNTYNIEKWIWYDGDAICMQWYDVKTGNVDSLYRATVIDCDSIIKKHKRALKAAN